MKLTDDQIKLILSKIPDRFVMAESARRLNQKDRAARTKNEREVRTRINAGRRVRKCKFCWQEFSAREMRAHCRDEHPGGKYKFPILLRASELPRKCPYCIVSLQPLALGLHIKKEHPGMPNTTTKEYKKTNLT